MNTLISLTVVVPFCLFWPVAQAQQLGSTFTYQTGSTNYNATQDVTISSQNLLWNANGTTYRDALNLCYKIGGTNAYETRTLLRFDGLAPLPAGTRLLSANLQLTFYTWQAGFKIIGAYLLAPWSVDTAGWSRRDSVHLWAAPGASGPGSDISQDAAPLVFSGFNGNGIDQTLTVPLDPATVSKWLQDPTTNNGIVLFTDTQDKPAKLYSSRDSILSRRPMLRITFGASGDSIPPTVTLMTPAPGSTVSGPLSLLAAAADNVGIASLQFLVDGRAYGLPIPAPPYSLQIDSRLLADGAHTFSARATDSTGNSTTAQPVTAFVNNVDRTPPTVSITTPTAGSSVSGTVTVLAAATDNVRVATVQFLLDGAQYGQAMLLPPYGLALDTATLASGPHVIVAKALDQAGNAALSSPITITVSAAPSSTTVAVQNGTNAYTGEQDLTITTQGGPNGYTYRDTLNMSYIMAGSSPYETRTLLKFTDLAPLVGRRRVVDARLQLTFSTWSAGFNIIGSYLIAPWDATATQLGWLKRDNLASWAAPGATGLGVDIDAGKAVRFSGFKAAGNQTMTVQLDPAIVEQWLSHPSLNQGLILVNDTVGAIAKIYSGRDSALEKRPRLVLTLGDVDTTLPAITLTSPAPGSVASGTITATAKATDDVSVAGVQFILDGRPVGAEVEFPPYELPLDTALLPNGVHTLVAQARDAAGNTASSAQLSLTVSNVVSQGVKTFLADRQPAGQIQVRLYPTELVRAGIPTLVTFGVPFTRGSVLPNDLAQIRVLKNGLEIPAYVGQLTPWRHVTNALADGQSVRIARVQFRYVFAVAYPGFEEITLEWGSRPRVANLPTAETVRSGWHQVTSGSFNSFDNIYEPDVFAVLPKDYLASGVLTLSRMLPFDPAVTEARSDPATMKAPTAWPGFLEFQLAAKNFFYTIINQDDKRVAASNLCPYRTEAEVWLYDRPAAMYQLYFQSGFVTALREAVRNAEFYAANLYTDSVVPASAIGVFRLKQPNPAGYIGGNGAMYSYNEGLAYTYWLTGDDTLLPHISWVAKAQNTQSEPTRWSPTATSWSERHAAFRLLANTVAYEIFGDPAYMLAETADFIWHQNGAAGSLPGTRIDGGLYHYGWQHGDGTPSALVASPWMSVLIIHAMVRTYALTDDPGTAEFVRRMGTFLKVASKADLLAPYTTPTSGPLRYADYMTAVDGLTNVRDGTEAEHALEIAAGLAWANFFAERMGKADPTLKEYARMLYDTYHYSVGYWTRPDGPSAGLSAFRVSPWRKYAWQYHPASSLPWLMQ